MGIMVDFELIDDLNSYYRFIYELSARFKAEGLLVTVKLEDNNIDRKKIEDVVDYIIE